MLPRRAAKSSICAIALACLIAIACATTKRSAETLIGEDAVGPVRVRIGEIDAPELDARMRTAPGAQPARTEALVDELWRAGCQAEAVAAPPPYQEHEPDVVCSLPGGTQGRIVVLAHLDGEAQPGG